MTDRTEELRELVRQKVEDLRPRLLDLTGRNPLIRVPVTRATSSYIRVVDELPDVLFHRLLNSMQMTFAPLPQLDEDPKDETTTEFRDALIAARQTDQSYIDTKLHLNSDAAGYLDKARKLERDLKDRVREHLGMSPRPTSKDFASLISHAKANGITPAYDLPQASEEDDERHLDALIQSLLLPKDMARTLNNIIARSRSWQQETGINVLQASFGILEWTDPNSRVNNFSPLLTLPVEIKANKTPSGTQFNVSGNGESAETNGVLRERLRTDFGIDLPIYAGGSCEDYFSEISEIAPDIETWRVRRQVIFGIFPSARIAMYHDLDTSKSEFSQNEVVLSLLAGKNSDGLQTVASDYEIDSVDERNELPFTIADADSSQLSTLIDVANGKNLAVEGPPGTGKSQTIVNAIVSAMAEGKKVLFVAEKLAALDVVRSRLAAAGLGPFILPLQAGRASKDQIIDALRSRLSAKGPKVTLNFDRERDRLNYNRTKLARYIEILTSEFEETELNVHQILGQAISTFPKLASLPPDFKDASLLPPSEFTPRQRQELADLLDDYDQARQDAEKNSQVWSSVTKSNMPPFEVDEVFDAIASAKSSYQELAKIDLHSQDFQIPIKAEPGYVETLFNAVAELQQSLGPIKLSKHFELLEPEKLLQLAKIIVEADRLHAVSQRIQTHINAIDITGISDVLERAASVCELFNLDHPDTNELEEIVSQRRLKIAALKSVVEKIEKLAKYVPECVHWNLTQFNQMHGLINTVGREVLEMRGPDVNSRGYAETVLRICENGKTLANKQIELEEFIQTIGVPDSAQLRSDMATFKASGSMSFLSGEYKRTKKRYLQITKRDKFEKNQAIADLTALATYLDAAASIRENNQAKTIFGIHFDGENTPFQRFEALAQYLMQIDSDFAGPDNASIRTFLKTEETDLIRSLPYLGGVTSSQDINDLHTLISDEARLLANADDHVATLNAVANILIDIKKVDGKNLVEVATDIRTLDGEKRELANIAQASNIDLSILEKDRDIYDHLVKFGQNVDFRGDALKPVMISLKNEKFSELYNSLKQCSQHLQIIEKSLTCVLEKLGVKQPELLTSGEDLEHWFMRASTDRNGLLAQLRLQLLRSKISDLGLGQSIKTIEQKTPPEASARQIIDAMISRLLARRVYETFGEELVQYSGSELTTLRSRLSEIDSKLLLTSKDILISMLIKQATPPLGNGVGTKASYTDMALILNEVEKKKRHIPVRELVRRSHDALLELMPCWMMSPQAVAQYVPNRESVFDLCIIDEASQMPPEDAIGAMFRSDQVMVVGDTNQLPPTSFFRKMLEDEDEDDEVETVLEESILEMAKATFRPARRLRWHYRSKHAGLINFSNHIIYEGDLVVFPSPDENRADTGVSLVSVKGSYKTGLNVIEGRAVADAVLKFMRQHPDKSLGVVTLNKKQADHIAEILDNEDFPKNPLAQKYLEHWENTDDGLQSFFVKNLENVQGDERDVIFISTVYGPEREGGPVMQRFGPINGLAGQRRLNVLFTRAKRQIITFSSMSSEDIRAEENTNKGTWMLKRWLEYSATGKIEAGETTGKEPDSDFERHVIEQIQAMGCEAVPQVGVSKYFIDIGIKHPDWPHGYILGVECDGATYHSAKSARDRDRLRQSVLEDLGWKLHRIWSTDWFNNARQEAEVLRGIISDRLRELKSENTARLQYPPALDGMLDSSVSAPDVIDDAPELDFEMGISSNQNEIIEGQPFKENREESKAVSNIISIGDTVRIRYLTHGKDIVQITISDKGNDPSKGLVGYAMPLAQAVLDAEEGDEIEILNGSYLRTAVIEKVLKKTGN